MPDASAMRELVIRGTSTGLATGKWRSRARNSRPLRIMVLLRVHGSAVHMPYTGGVIGESVRVYGPYASDE